MSQDICVVLSKILQPDTEVVKQGTIELNTLLSQSNGVSELCKVLVNGSVTPDIKQCAATMLRRHLMSNKTWQKLSAPNKDELRSGLLSIIDIECDNSVRTALAMLIGLVARHEPWPQLLQYTHTLASSDQLPKRQLSLYLLSVIGSEAVQSLLPHCADLLPILDSALQDSSLPTPTIGHVIVTIARLVEVINSEHIGIFQGVVRNVVVVSQRLLATDEQPVWETIELLETLVESEIPVLAPDLPSIVQFCIQLSTNAELGDGLRIKAISFLGIVTRYKKKYLVKNKLCDGIILGLFSVLCEEAADDNPLGLLLGDNIDSADSNEDEVMQSAAQSLDTCARHLAPDKLLTPLMPAIEESLKSEDNNKVKGGYLALAMITDGCSERLRTKHLDILLQCVCNGVRSEAQVVRGSALFALSQFADYLQPDISKYHHQLLPIIFTYLTQICEGSKSGQPDPPGTSRLFYAVEVFCENMEQEDLLPHLPTLLQHVMEILHVTGTSNHMKKNAISVIGAVALCCKDNMAPYFEQIVSLLKNYLLMDGTDDSTPLQLQSLETLSQLTRSLGEENMQKYASDITQLALNLLEKASQKEEPELKKTCYRLFAALASVIHDNISESLPVIVDSMINSLKSTEGVVTHVKNDANRAILQSLGEVEYSDDEEGADNDLDVAGYSVENVFMEEKEDTCVALRELANSCKGSFVPFIPKISDEVFKLVSFPNDDVKQAALVTITHFVIALSKSESAESKQAFDYWVQIVVTKIAELVKSDEYSVVTAGLESYAELLTGVGEKVLHYKGHLETMLDCITLVFNKKTKCQVGELDDTDEDEVNSMDEAEMDEMLVESAGDIIVPLGKTLGPKAFSQHVPRLITLLTKRLRPGSTECVRSYVVGNLAEIVDVLTTECGPFINMLLQIFMGGSRDFSGEVRSNSIYGLGLLGLHGGEVIVQQLHIILTNLSEIMPVEKEVRVMDNICAALARIIGAHWRCIPVATILPAVINFLPLKEDFEENVTVFSTFLVLYQQQEPSVLQHIGLILSAASFIYTTPQCDPQCQAVIEDLVRRVNTGAPDALATIIASMEPQLAERLKRAKDSSAPSPPEAAKK